MFAVTIRKHPSRWRKSPRSTGRASGQRSRAFAILRSWTPFAYLQCYRNADYPEWGRLIGVDGGISVDLFIGDPEKGWGGPR